MPLSAKKSNLATLMPAMLRHTGTWQGTYLHQDVNGATLDKHNARVICEFPESGEYAYIQHNLFTWEDGSQQEYTLPGRLKDNKLWWDTPTFSGCAWQTDYDVILLNLSRKDEVGAHFFEMITLGDTGQFRSRTWQWFKDGKLYKRTLCDEQKVSDELLF